MIHTVSLFELFSKRYLDVTVQAGKKMSLPQYAAS